MKRRSSVATSGRLPLEPTDDEIATVLIVLALPEERDYFLSVVQRRPKWTCGSARSRSIAEFRSSFGRVRVIIQTLVGMGNIEASLGASSAIATVSPDLAFLVGLAGTLDPVEVQPGDVVVSNQAKLYSGDKIRTFTAKPNGGRRFRYKDEPTSGQNEIILDRRDSFMSNSFIRYERKVVESTPTDDIISTAEIGTAFQEVGLKRIPPEFVPSRYRNVYRQRAAVRTHLGWLLASSHVVDSAEYRDYLVEKNTDFGTDVHRQTGDADRVRWKDGKLLAVDMESYGFLRAVELLRTTHQTNGGVPNLLGGIVVRGISDCCEEKTESDTGSGEETRKAAVENATEIALRLVETVDFGLIATR